MSGEVHACLDLGWGKLSGLRFIGDIYVVPEQAIVCDHSWHHL